MSLSRKSRKKILANINYLIEQESIIKKLAEENDLQAADAEDYSEKIFNKLLESTKIEGLED